MAANIVTGPVYSKWRTMGLQTLKPSPRAAHVCSLQMVLVSCVVSSTVVCVKYPLHSLDGKRIPSSLTSTFFIFDFVQEMFPLLASTQSPFSRRL